MASDPQTPKAVFKHLLRTEKLSSITGSKTEIFKRASEQSHDTKALENLLGKLIDLKVKEASRVSRVNRV